MKKWLRVLLTIVSILLFLIAIAVIVSDVDLTSGTCTLTVGDRVTKNLGVYNIVSDIAYNNMVTITNLSVFKNWKGFK